MDDNYVCNVPVVILAYNRPEMLRRVLDAVKLVRAKQVLVVIDGPNRKKGEDEDKRREEERVVAVRQVALDPGWTCALRFTVADHNMGLRRRVTSGLDWVFENVERAIILEDDCVPDPSFFQYCEELLDKYADDERIMTIGGTTYVSNPDIIRESYFYSRYMMCWGWATWRRAWQLHDDAMTQYPGMRDDGWFEYTFNDPAESKYWSFDLEHVYESAIESWAYRWLFSVWCNSGLNILPRHNMISNIGFTPDATHTKDVNDPRADMPRTPMTFPMEHPSSVMRNVIADAAHARSYQKPFRRFDW